MKTARPARPVRLRLAALVASSALLAACGEELLVRTDSRTYADGGIARRIDVSGREGDGSSPAAPDWLEAQAGVQLARPEAWRRVDRGPGWLTAEGFFPAGTELVPTLAYSISGHAVADRTTVEFRHEDLVVGTLWTWRETAADPSGGLDEGAAIDTLVALASRAVGEEVERTFGAEVDPAPAQRFFRNDVRKLLVDLLPSIRAELARASAATGVPRDAWRKTLARHGVPLSADGAELFSKQQIEHGLDWSRARVARALATRARSVAPEELRFWPIGDDAEARAAAVIRDVWGSDEALQAEAGPALEALGGYYGRRSTPRFRFDFRLRLPGRLLRTNGTPEGESIVWSLRDESLMASAAEMTAASLELAAEPLRTLGARPELDAVGCLQLVDLLSARETSAELRRWLRTAVDEGKLGILRDDERIPEALQPAAVELADLLDPRLGALSWTP